MKIRRQTRLPRRLAHDWVRFVIRRNSSHFPPIRDRSGLTFFPGRLSHFRPAPIGSAAQPQALFGALSSCRKQLQVRRPNFKCAAPSQCLSFRAKRGIYCAPLQKRFFGSHCGPRNDNQW